jgi:hypothetical protein
MISAPIQTIWDIQTDVAAWPSWQPDVDGAEADGPLANLKREAERAAG